MIETVECPPAVARIVTLARDNGWTVLVTSADGPPPSLALRARRGIVRMWVYWRTDDGVKYQGGAHNVEGAGMHLSTLTKAKALLSSNAAAVDEWLSAR